MTRESDGPTIRNIMLILFALATNGLIVAILIQSFLLGD